MNKEILTIVFEDVIDNEAIMQLKDSLSQFGDDVEFHEIPEEGPQVSVLLLGMASIAVIFGGAFIKKLGDKAAEDCYPLFKHGLSKIYRKYFGKDPEYKVQIISTSKKKVPDDKYSLVFAMYCVGSNSENIKYLYITSWTQEQFDTATGHYLSSMANFINNEAGEIQELLDNEPSRIEPALITWDQKSAKLIKINPFPDHVRI